MGRYIPRAFQEYTEERQMQKKVEQQKQEKKKKSQSAAIERGIKRKQLLDQFCEAWDVDPKGELCMAIKKIMSDGSTKNIPLAAYQRELETIGCALDKVGLDFVTLKVVGNAANKYKHLVYEGQLERGFHNYSQKSGIKNNAKDLTKDSKNTKSAKLEDFEVYRSYLTNPNDDNELKDFIHQTFGISVVE